MKKIRIILFIIFVIIIFLIGYFLLKVPNDNHVIVIPLGEERKINTNDIYDNEYISIDENGNIRGLKKGKTTIVIDDIEYTIKVVDPVLDVNTYEDNINIGVNFEYYLNIIKKDDIKIIDYEYDENIISFENNTIKGLKKGKTNLKIITDNNSYKNINITVEDVNISLSHKKMNLLIGEEKKISIYSNIEIDNVLWNTDNDNISIENGIVKGLKKGNSLISININDIIYTCEVTIKDTVDSFYLNSNFVNLNKNEEFIVESNVPFSLIKFEISDNNIIELNDNKLKAKSSGKTIIKASIFDKVYYMVVYVGNIEYNFNYDDNFINYFGEIALKNEYINNENSKKIQKWNSPIYYNYINASDKDIEQIEKISSILNDIPGFPGMYYSNNNPNLVIDFTSYEYLYGLTKVYGVEGYSTIDFNNNIIFSSNIYINSNLDDSIKKSVIAEEILHSIGLKNDTKNIADSVLYEYGSKVEELSDYDLLACQILYSKYINYGMSDIMVKDILKNNIK